MLGEFAEIISIWKKIKKITEFLLMMKADQKMLNFMTMVFCFSSILFSNQ